MSRMTPYVLMLVGSIASSLLFAAHRSTPIAGASSARSAASQAQADRFRPRSGMRSERPRGGTPADTPTEAPTGFDNLSNGFDPQGPDYETLNEDNVVALRSFNDNRFIFENFEGVADGLGPTYNAQSCRECHQNVVTGARARWRNTARVTELNQFLESLGGSLIQSRATHPGIMEHVAFEDDVRTFRISTNTLGDGFVEAIANETLMAIRDAQPAAMRGIAVLVPVLEGDGSARIGRFGWKCQHASLESFAADAYLNEMGITSPLFPEENTSAGNYIGFGSGYDDVADPEDDGEDVVAFANFMRATKAPPRPHHGRRARRRAGLPRCRLRDLPYAEHRHGAAGAVVNGGAFTLPRALGSKIIHPYSDYLLHDVGTGDGIPILPDAAYAFTASQMRTAPLWALRTRNRMMHDGLSFTLREAIQRHGGQASAVTAQFLALDPAQQALLYRFLESL